MRALSIVYASGYTAPYREIHDDIAMRPIILAALLLLNACATTHLPINQGTFSEETPSTALEKSAVGKRVRWGGTIVSVAPSREATCFEVLSRPLDSYGEPRQSDTTEGRFIACSALFFDPAAYPAGRHITISATVQPATTCKIGEHEHACPRANIEALHLWPKREQCSCAPCGNDPFWGHRWPFWPWRYP